MKIPIVIILLLFTLQFVSNAHLKSNTLKVFSKLTTKQKELTQGQSLESKNKKYFAKMQDDGNFVVYSSSSQNGRGKDHPTWASNTNGSGTGPYRVDMQEDGNLVLYDSKNSALWASGTNGRGNGPYKTIMQDDGNLVLYDSEEKAQWASGTNGKQ
jgi:hypothetical protein